MNSICLNGKELIMIVTYSIIRTLVIRTLIKPTQYQNLPGLQTAEYGCLYRLY